MKFFQSSFIKLTLLYMSVLTLVGTIILYWSLSLYLSQSKNNLEHLINTDMSGLVALYSVQGGQALSEHLTNILNLTPLDSPQQFYLFIDKEGNKLAGNIEKWPEAAKADSTLLEVKTPKPNHHELFAKSTLLSKGYRLFVGRNAAEYKMIEQQLYIRIFMGIIAFMMIGFLSGTMISRAFLRRIKVINDTYRAVENGNIKARVPSTGSGNEIDILGRGLNTMLDRIANLISIQKQTSDNIAHEVRSPLMRLNAIIDKGVRNSDISPEVAELAERQIKESVTLLDQLLDISMIETTGKNQSPQSSIKLCLLLENIVELYQPIAEDKNVSLTLDLQIPQNFAFKGNEQQLYRLCSNLIDNALKFARSKIKISLTKDNNKIILTFKDDGTGIPPDLQDKVFNRFSKAHDHSEKGYGLGLALVKAIADQHDFHVSLKSSDKGTEFNFMADINGWNI